MDALLQLPASPIAARSSALFCPLGWFVLIPGSNPSAARNLWRAVRRGFEWRAAEMLAQTGRARLTPPLHPLDAPPPPSGRPPSPKLFLALWAKQEQLSCFPFAFMQLLKQESKYQSQ